MCSAGPHFLTLPTTWQNGARCVLTAHPLFSDMLAFLSKVVFKHVSLNVKLISDNKYQSSGISFL